MRTHNDIKELLGAYALDAVDEDERRTVEEHLPSCTVCRDEVDRHRSVASMLSCVEESVPSGLWDRVEASLVDPAQDPVMPIRRNARWSAVVTGVAAAALAAVIGLQAARIQSLQRDLDDTTATIGALESQLASGDFTGAVELVASRADTQTLALEGSAGQAVVILLPDGTGYLLSESLQALTSDQTYQLWTVQHGDVVSAGLLGSQPHAVPFRIDLESLEGLVLTVEPAGGVVVSEQSAAAAWFPPDV